MAEFIADPDVLELVAQRELGDTERTDEGCLLSRRYLDGCGYRQVQYKGRYLSRAHRIVWEFLTNEPLGQLTIDHLCRSRACLNVEHMEPVTLSENQRRAAQLRRKEAQGRGVCANGHPWSEETRYVNNGTWYCRRCNAAAQRRLKQRQKDSL